MTKTKKGQVQMTETIAVIFIFFVLVLFGLLFFYKYTQGAVERERIELLGKKSIETSLQTLFLPELICSNGEAEPVDNCIDMIKLNFTQQLMKEHADYYWDIFTYASVTVFQIYPEYRKIELYKKPKPNAENAETSYFIIALRDQKKGGNEDNFGFGYLRVMAYS